MSDYLKLKEMYDNKCKELRRTKYYLNTAYQREDTLIGENIKLKEQIKELKKELYENKLLLVAKIDYLIKR